MNKLYLYLVSSGEYSSYGVSSIAVSKERITKEQLKQWEKELENSTEDRDKFLIDKGLQIVYPAGEFWQGYGFGASGREYNFEESVREGEENAFRISLG